MATEVPASATEIAAIAEAAGALGIQTPAILGFTRTMIDLGESTDLTADQAGNALARLANIMQMPQDEFDNLGSAIVALGNDGASTESEITEMALRIAGAGKQVGLTEAEVVSFGSALASVGVDAEAGGSAISRAFITIAQAVQGGGKELEGFADVAGMSGEQFAQTFEQDAAGAMVAFIEGLGKMGDSGKDVFGVLDKLGLGEIRVRDALLRASGAGKLFSDQLEVGSDAWRENIALTEEANKRYATTESQLEMTKNKLTEAGIAIGEILLPFVMKAAEWVSRMAEAFKQLDPTIQKVIVGVAAVAVAIGPALFIFGSIAKVLAFLVTPAGLVVAALIAIGVALVYAYNHSKTFRDFVQDAFETVKGIVQSAGPVIERAIAAIGDAFNSPMFGKIVETAKSVFSSLAEVVGTAMDAIAEVVRSVIDILTTIWRNYGDVIFKALESAFTAILGIITNVWNAIAGIIRGALNVIKGIFNVLAGIITLDWERAWEGLKQIVDGVWDALFALVKGAIGVIVAIVKGLGGLLWAAAQGIFRLLWNAFKAGWELIFALFREAPKLIVQGLSALGGLLLRLANSALNLFLRGVKTGAIAVWNFMRALPGRIVSGLSKLGGMLLRVGSSALRALLGAVRTGAVAVWNFFRELPGRVAGALARLPGLLLRVGTQALRALWNGIKAAAAAVWNFFRELPGRVISAIGNIGSRMVSVGGDIIQGLIDGLNAAWGSVSAWFAEKFSQIPGWAKSLLGIGSPSKVFRGIGEDTMAGFMLGLERSARNVQRSLEDAMPTYAAPGFAAGGNGLAAVAARGVPQGTRQAREPILVRVEIVGGRLTLTSKSEAVIEGVALRVVGEERDFGRSVDRQRRP